MKFLKRENKDAEVSQKKKSMFEPHSDILESFLKSRVIPSKFIASEKEWSQHILKSRVGKNIICSKTVEIEI